MANIVVLAIVGLILGLACGHIYKEKKRGVKCIGCPGGCSCSGGCANCPGCRKS